MKFKTFLLAILINMTDRKCENNSSVGLKHKNTNYLELNCLTENAKTTVLSVQNIKTLVFRGNIVRQNIGNIKFCQLPVLLCPLHGSFLSVSRQHCCRFLSESRPVPITFLYSICFLQSSILQ